MQAQSASAWHVRVHSAFLLGLLGAAWPILAAQAQSGAPEAARQKELMYLLRQDCGSCHGMTLAGGLGPSLKPEALTGKYLETLQSTIFMGRPGTAMPPWKPFMSEAEAGWLAEQLMRGIKD